MRLICVAFQILFSNAIRNPLFTYYHTISEPRNTEFQEMSLFGFKIIPSLERESLIVTSPGQQNPDGNNRGGVWKCEITFPQKPSTSLTNNNHEPQGMMIFKNSHVIKYVFRHQ
ncbi:hypothetical protein RF11_16321 [Thelohanellus kitauei]|uniref:Uncharacterized protein n=1 Tax=Thelohanellus kitauei TaxID=669202 RepID=A0A0C2MD29_THEKT|nr:hypothetical protein RF11_16321 [Thelohanellus kitauei]